MPALVGMHRSALWLGLLDAVRSPSAFLAMPWGSVERRIEIATRTEVRCTHLPHMRSQKRRVADSGQAATNWAVAGGPVSVSKQPTDVGPRRAKRERWARPRATERSNGCSLLRRSPG